MHRGVYPGSFDPVTLGHLNIIERAAPLFDELIVAIVKNPGKEPLFTLEERVDMIKNSVKGNPMVRVECFSGLLVKFVEEMDARVIVKGLRALSDFDYEFQMALMNRKLYPRCETIFLMTEDRFAFLSSSSVREIAALGGSVKEFVAPYVEEMLRKKFGYPAEPVLGQDCTRD